MFAKAPVAGQVKTRLARAIGPADAARLAERMLDHALAAAVAADVGPVELRGTPARHPLLQTAAARHAVGLAAQGAGDLGRRLASAFRQHLRDGPVLVIGTDCPALSAQRIEQAASALGDHDAVFVPALDGGYVLIGLRRYQPPLFEDIAWGTSTVMAETRRRLRRLGWRWWEAQPLADVDEADDLVHVPPAWRA